MEGSATPAIVDWQSNAVSLLRRLQLNIPFTTYYTPPPPPPPPPGTGRPSHDSPINSISRWCIHHDCWNHWHLYRFDGVNSASTTNINRYDKFKKYIYTHIYIYIYMSILAWPNWLVFIFAFKLMWLWHEYGTVGNGDSSSTKFQYIVAPTLGGYLVWLTYIKVNWYRPNNEWSG